MPWPQSFDYNLSIQNPHLSFQDEDLRACTAWTADPVMGLPTPRPGNFADVYQMIHPDGTSRAVKCFTREVDDLHDRYAAISEFLERTQRSFLIEFRYLDQGILVNGGWYPVLKMRWVEGLTLNEFVREQADSPGVLDKLAQMWLKLARDLREAKIGHGDLQHGNVLLVPNPQKGSFHLRLIDYDGMYVPALANRPSQERGYPGFQHPQRAKKNLFGPEVDRFSHLVIYTALRALRVGGAKLWNTFGTPENLLFGDDDFAKPAQSRLLRALFELPDASLRHLLGHLVLAALGDVGQVPLLDEIAPDGVPRRLETAEFVRLRAEVGAILGGVRRSKLVATADRLEDLPPLPGTLESQDQPVLVGRTVPEARRLDEANSLPEWMLPEAVPMTDETILQRLPAEISEPMLKMVVKPIDPVERKPEPRLRYHPVLIEESTSESAALPVPVAEAIPDAIPVADRDDDDDSDDEIDPPSPNRPRFRLLPLLFRIGVLLAMATATTLLVLWLRREPPPPKPLIDCPAEVVVVTGTAQTARFHFRRNGYEGKFSFAVLDVPRSVEALEVWEPIDLGEDWLFRFRAELTAPEGVFPVRVVVRDADGEVAFERPMRIVLIRPSLPAIVPPTKAIRMEVGQFTAITFEIDRRGRAEMLEFELTDLSPGMLPHVPAMRPNEPVIRASCWVPAGQMLGTAIITARLYLVQDRAVGGTRFEVDSRRIAVNFARPRPTEPFVSASVAETRLSPRFLTLMEVKVDRQLFPEPLRLTLQNLPPGVTAEPIDISRGEARGRFSLRTAPNLAPFPPTRIDIVALEGGEEIGRAGTALRLDLP